MKILVIQHKMIGDVLTSSILFELLRKKYPQAQLEYLINENTQAVVQNNPNIDQIRLFLPIFDHNVKARNAFYQELEQEKYELVIDVYAKLRSAALTRLLKPRRSVSYHKWYTNFAYKKTVKPLTETQADEGLAIVNRILLLKAIYIDVAEIPKPKIYLSDKEKAQASNLLTEKQLDKSKPLFMISAFGSGENKTYPLTYMAAVLDHLVDVCGANLIFNYMPAQQAELNALLALCSEGTKEHSRTDIYGQRLREFLALTAQCDAVIGNEGGAINMAKALNIPSFAIYCPWILKSAWNSYEASGDNQSIHLSDIKPGIYKNHPKKYKNKAAVLYNELLPKMVIRQLDLFLDHHGFRGSKP